MERAADQSKSREQLIAELNVLRSRLEALLQEQDARRQAEDALRQSEERLRQIIDLVPHMIFAKDAEGRYILANKAAAEAHGMTVEQFLGMRHDQIHPDPAEVQRMLEDDREVIHSGRVKIIPEETYLRSDGSRRVLRTIKIPYTALGSGRPAVLGVAVDITDEKQAEEKLREAKRVAESANQTKDQFLAALSHELRTPLTPVLIAAQMLETDPSLPPELREPAEMIHRNVQLEVRLIDDLLDLTRIERGKVPLDLQAVDAHEKLRQVVQICDSDVWGKQLVLDLELLAAQHHVDADPMRLPQVLWNLLKNAIKFTPVGGQIWVRTWNEPPSPRADMPGGIAAEQAPRIQPGHWLAIEVQDTGIGIAPETLPLVFDAFEQGGTEVTRLFGGLGLGLTISKGLAEMHGGTITVASRGKGCGATFTLRLPVSVSAVGPRAIAIAGGDEPDAEGRRILLVEDHADTRRIMSRVLAGCGYEVRTAEGVASALRAAETDLFDLVISDIGLPDGTGYELMQQLLARRRVQGIALSGFGHSEDIRRSKEAGFVAHLTKPVDVHIFRDTIRRLLHT